MFKPSDESTIEALLIIPRVKYLRGSLVNAVNIPQIQESLRDRMPRTI